MKSPEEQKHDYFSLASTINQTSFEGLSHRQFFQTWCEKNDSLIPDFLTDRDWEKRKISKLIERQSDGKKTLYIPYDIRLWEMVAVCSWVDHDTFANQPVLAQKATHELQELGRMFSLTGVYVSKRLAGIEPGQEIARELAQKFYYYGNQLQGRDVTEDVRAGQIANQQLTNEDTQAVDHWIAGENVYSLRLKKAQAKISKNPQQEVDILETYRIDSLNQFFRVAKQGLARRDEGRQDFVPSDFLKKVEERIAWTIETPKRELTNAIFRHGIGKLVHELRSTRFGNRWESALKWYVNDILRMAHRPGFEPQSLTYELNLQSLRKTLKQAQKSRNPEKIAKTEYAAALKIQEAISAFPYLSLTDTPQEIIAKQRLNCLGATILGGALMRELGISYLPVSLPGHAIIFLITSNEKVFWFDLIGKKFNTQLIEDEPAKPETKNEPTLTDIIEFSKHPKIDCLKLDMSSPSMREHFFWLDPGDERYAYLFPPQFGEELMVLGNTAYFLTMFDRYEEAEEMYKVAIAKNPKLPFAYAGLCDVLQKLGKTEDVIRTAKKWLVLDPNDAELYNQLGIAYFARDDFHQAEINSRKAIDLEPQESEFYRNLLAALLKQKRTKETLEVVIRASSVDLFKMGDVSYKQVLLGNPLALANSVRYYKEAISVDPSFKYSYFGLGRSFQHLGFKEKAVEWYTKFLELANSEKDKEWIELTKAALEKLSVLDK